MTQTGATVFSVGAVGIVPVQKKKNVEASNMGDLAVKNWDLMGV